MRALVYPHLSGGSRGSAGVVDGLWPRVVAESDCITDRPLATEDLLVRPGLVTCFDLGRSFGLNDAAIRKDMRNPEPDLGMVGIRNPLGQGTTTDLLASHSSLVESWRAEARSQLRRSVLDIGYEDGIAQRFSRAELVRALDRLVGEHPITTCDVTVFGMGVVYVCLEFGPGVEPYLMNGLLAAYEYAGYREPIADGLRSAAEATATLAMRPLESDFTRLTRRPPPESLTSTEDGEVYAESTLISSFTGVVRCVDPGDEGKLAEILGLLDIARDKKIDYERHGLVHYSWASCVLIHHEEPPATPDEQLGRIEQGIRIAHVSTGACEALLGLFQAELNEQVGYYVTRERGGRGPEDLNKLRTIALATVNITNFARVAQAEEDRKYFQLFAEDAQLEQTRDLLRGSVEVLYSVQEAAAQYDLSRRENFLNVLVIVLTSLTIVSVTADAYNFVRDQEALIGSRILRLQLLAEFVLALAALVTVMLWFLVRTPRRRS